MQGAPATNLPQLAVKCGKLVIVAPGHVVNACPQSLMGGSMSRLKDVLQTQSLNEDQVVAHGTQASRLSVTQN